MKTYKIKLKLDYGKIAIWMLAWIFFTVISLGLFSVFIPFWFCETILNNLEIKEI